jgi:hypothetical protein
MASYEAKYKVNEDDNPHRSKVKSDIPEGYGHDSVARSSLKTFDRGADGDNAPMSEAQLRSKGVKERAAEMIQEHGTR